MHFCRHQRPMLSSKGGEHVPPPSFSFEERKLVRTGARPEENSYVTAALVTVLSVSLHFYFAPLCAPIPPLRMRLVPVALFVLVGLQSFFVHALRSMTPQDYHARRVRAEAEFERKARAQPPLDAPVPGTKAVAFSNPKAQQFYGDGKSIPEVNWDVGPSWSGLMPISNKTGETRKLFFWFFPPGPLGSMDDLIF